MPFFKRISFFLFLLFSLQSISQNADSLIHEEINLKIWKPFCESYASLNATTFNDLHSEDVVKVSPWGIRIGNEYKDQNLERFKANKEKGTNRTIALWFEHRKTTPAISYEVGYYKVTYKNDDKNKYSYGRFHVVIKKENGTWKIAQDWGIDKINGIEVTEKDWLKGRPLVFK